MPGRQKAEVFAHCPAQFLANADRVFAHAAASVHTAYSSTGLRHSDLTGYEEPGHLFLIPRTTSKTCNRGHSQKCFPSWGRGADQGDGCRETCAKPKVVSDGLSWRGSLCPPAPAHVCQLDFRRSQVWVPRRLFAFQKLMSAPLSTSLFVSHPF